MSDETIFALVSIFTVVLVFGPFFVLSLFVGGLGTGKKSERRLKNAARRGKRLGIRA